MERDTIRRSSRFRPEAQRVEGRQLLSGLPAYLRGIPPELEQTLRTGVAIHLVRPNTPVAPFGAPSSPTFVDPSVRLRRGFQTLIGSKSYVAPFALLDASAGYIKIGTGSNVLDNATIVGNPNHLPQPAAVLIGDQVSIGPGATVLGPATIGAYGKAAAPTRIGANALIDGATIMPGAIVSGLARVGPGVVVPSGMKVQPGVDVTTEAEATDPKLGFVTPVTSTDTSQLKAILANNTTLAAGYTNLYQGQSATGVSPGVPTTVKNVFTGNLSTVEGVGPEPGTSTVAFEPSSGSPSFLAPDGSLATATSVEFSTRIIGRAEFAARLKQVAYRLGRHTSIRADQSQPFTFDGAPTTGQGVTIAAPLLYTPTSTTEPTFTTPNLVFGTNLVVGPGAVILGGQTSSTSTQYVVGDNVNIGSGAYINQSSIGTGSIVGARAYISGTTLPAGTVVPPGTVIVNNKVTGTVQW
ncbi:MAG TPA: carbonic anhydrase/acetyltransferase [Isosphaeraceae bacterium]|jgi:carbonic anhydrase/acetyltransferase-like protein (isoleucine patch superfamily)|nr:carbonic anhydrase/acetyltransferase [Isosphaeraceae bacterium]